MVSACPIEPPVHPDNSMTRQRADTFKPVLIAGFPGSSSDFVRLLVEVTTGFWTTGKMFRNDVIGIKTHYPVYSNHLNEKSPFGETLDTLLIVQNPLTTIEEFHDYIELSKHKSSIIIKQSVDSWIKWRNKNFDTQLDEWEKYMRHYPTWRVLLGSLIGMFPNVRYHVCGQILDESQAQEYVDNQVHMSTTYTPTYTPTHMKETATALNALKIKYFDRDKQLGQILKNYWEYTIQII